MKSLFIIGDMHIETQKEWCEEFFEKFYQWLEQINIDSYNPDIQDRELICLGDITDRNMNDGRTIEKVVQIFNLFLTYFSKIYVIQGNHDAGLKQMGYFSSIQFLPHLNSKSIEVISEEKIFTSKNGFVIEALPHQSIENQSIENYYSNDLAAEFYTTPVDLLCGHVAIKEENQFQKWGGVTFDKFKKAKHIAMGHIHVRNGKYANYYTGSIGAFKFGEDVTSLPRIIKILHRDENNDISPSEIKIPEFIKYETAKFGETLKNKKNSDTVIHIYRLTEAKNLPQARDFYKGFYIGSIEPIIYNRTTQQGSLDIKAKTGLEYLKAMLSETKYPIKRESYKILKELLS